MIALLVFLALFFAWAVVATAVAIAQNDRANVQTALVVKGDQRIAELEDRVQARNLAEFRAYRPVAMPVAEAEPEGYWRYDPTGLVREWVPASEAEEATG